MAKTLAWILGLAAALTWPAPVGAQTDVKVALRVGGGPFLRACEDGSLRADRLFPSERETYRLVPCPDDHVALKAPDGRFFIAEGRSADRVRADSPRTEPGERETFLLVALGENRAAMKVRGYRDPVTFDAPDIKPTPAETPDEPRADQTLELFHAAEIPSAVRSGLELALRALLKRELGDRQYDKIRSKRKVEHIELPAPTLRDPGRKKKHRVYAVREETRVQAQLDGRPEIKVLHLPYLKGYHQAGLNLLMFQVEAVLPVRGRVGYRIPDRLSVSTAFRTVMELNVVGQFEVVRQDDEFSFDSPEVLDISVKMHRLEVSNDLLNLTRRQVRDLINQELRDNHARILRQANKELHKAVEAREFRHPLLRFL